MLKNKKILLILTSHKDIKITKNVLHLAQYLNQNNEVHILTSQKEIDNIFLENCHKNNIKILQEKYLIAKFDLGKDYLMIPKITKLLNTNKYNLIHTFDLKAGFLISLATHAYRLNPTNIRLRLIHTTNNIPYLNLKKIKKYFIKKIFTITISSHDIIITTIPEKIKDLLPNYKLHNPHTVQEIEGVYMKLF